MRPYRVTSIVLSVAALTGCGTLAPKTFSEARTTTPPPPVTIATTGSRPIVVDVIGAAKLALGKRAEDQRHWLVAAAVTTTTTRPVVRSAPVPSSNPAPVGISDVMVCIQGHESGNYTEATHPDSGSGAYQYVPGTWRTWFGRWVAATGYTGPWYDLAYLAPAEIQDAVTAWTLTQPGGPGNWSNRYGNDPCTAGLPGGG